MTIEKRARDSWLIPVGLSLLFTVILIFIVNGCNKDIELTQKAYGNGTFQTWDNGDLIITEKKDGVVMRKWKIEAKQLELSKEDQERLIRDN
jgi:hypothetical protein